MIKTYSPKAHNLSESIDMNSDEIDSAEGLIYNSEDLTDSESESLISATPNNFNDFTYSKKSHLKYFLQNNFDSILYGKKIEPTTLDNFEYQNLLVYSFIIRNIPKGSKILEIGNKHSVLSNILSKDYEYWMLSEIVELTDNKISELNIHLYNNSDEKLKRKNLTGYFDFIFSVSSFELIVKDSLNLKYFNILTNLHKLTNINGYNLHCFYVIIKNNSILLNQFLYQFFKLYKFGNRTVNDYIEPESIIDSEFLYSQNRTFTGLKHNFPISNPNQYINAFSYSVLQKNDPKLSEYTNSERSFYLNKKPAYFFHHLMKCGGTSLHEILTNWFNLEFDQLETNINRDNFLKYKYNLDNLLSDSCITGHFQYNGIYLHQRYPEIFERNNEFKIFTFIREPLQVRISHYYYLKGKGIFDFELCDYLLVDNNFLASLFPCDENNYKEVLDRYLFIGIVERMQESMDKLADILNKRKLKVPVVNVSVKDSQRDFITPEFIKEFKELNKLDFLIYDYCVEKFNKIK